MTTTAPAKPKVKRRDALVGRLTISIPLTTNKPESYAEAVKALEGIQATMPEGTAVVIQTSLGKV